MCSCQNPQEIEMVFVEGGKTAIGSSSSNAQPDEKEYTTTIHDFYISKYEVTQAQWVAVMKYNPSTFIGANLPVESVNYDDVQKFINRLNTKTGLKYRLPTEQEWEYAAKGGCKSKNYIYSGSNDIQSVGWSSVDKKHTTSDVGMKQPNELGLYDMTGNVYEWCDGLYENTYFQMDTTLCNNYDISEIRIFRGGAWNSAPEYCRSTNRNYNTRTLRSTSLGFRLALDAE